MVDRFVPHYSDGTSSTTAVPRPVRIDVRDHGAALNGSTDDTAAAQAALDAARTAGGWFVDRTMNSGVGRRSVYPGVPGSGMALALRGAGNGNEDAGPYGSVDVVRTDPNRTRMFRMDGDSGEFILGSGALYVDAGALKYRSSGGTVTTIAPA